MNNTPNFKRKKQNKKRKIILPRIVLAILILQLSINTITSVSKLISNNAHYYELTKCMENITLLNDEIIE